ncbi:AAA family ATPase [Marinobacter sp. LV10MA510-1]|uniref:AAA family ATPase n=1 Tax=Marinobacter sp. LV10MA510-1 TaxID=1415567 RepID=UPI000BF7604F|nr:DUF3696 domain-containing protein [Marinobacter sp. LV10MA510-1]PFG09261.1 putative ATPase [Marinobacter sp. LV10MA510-1]
MINSLSINNFKSFPNETLDLAPLTLLAGLNSSGKSSVIQALRMHNAALAGQSPLLTGYGGLDELRSRFSSPKDAVTVGLRWKGGQTSNLVLNDNHLDQPKKGPEFFYVGADRLGPQPNLPMSGNLLTSPHVGDRGEFAFDFVTRLIEQNYIVPDLLRHDNAQSMTFEHVLQGWLSEISPGVKFTFNRVKKADITHAEVDSFRPTNVGFGLSYTLPIIAAALGSAAKPVSDEGNSQWVEAWEARKQTNGVLLALENPEAHLHPRGQTAMGRLLALCAAHGTQVVVETHSEHVMDAIRIAVKSNEITSDQVKFYYFSKNNDMPTKVHSPVLSENGKLDFWPEGFFDQTLKNRAMLAKR